MKMAVFSAETNGTTFRNSNDV